MPYIDIKETIWRRYKYTNNVDIDNLIEKIKNDDIICIGDEGFIKQELMLDTVEDLTVEENDGEATIELYDDNDWLVYDNKNGKY